MKKFIKPYEEYTIDGYRHWSSVKHHQKIEETTKLYEGLITTYPYSSVANYINSTVSTKFYNYIKLVRSTIFNLQIKVKDMKDVDNSNMIYEIINKIENVYGWVVNCTVFFVQSNEVHMIKGYYDFIKVAKGVNADMILIQFESKYPILMKVREIPKILYHVSPSRYKSSIMKKGLIPKSNNSKYKHPDRVYLFDSVDMIDDVISKLNVELDVSIDRWTVYMIDGHLFKVNNYELFTDTLYTMDVGMSYFTKRNISPQWIISSRNI